jgi:hypothetical protein
MSTTERADWLPVGQIIIGILGALVSLVFSLIAIIAAVGMWLNQGGSAEMLPFFMLATVGGLVLFCNTVSVVLAFRQMGGKLHEATKAKGRNLFLISSLAMLAFPLILIAGQLVNQSTGGWFLLPALSLLALLLPIWWMVELGRRGLPASSPQRTWGLISLSLTFMPILAMLAEVAVIVVIGVLIFSILSGQVEWAARFQQVTIQLSQMEFDLAYLEELLRDLLRNPLVMPALLLMAGGMMPLLEELIKPIGLWVLRKRRMTPADGFSAGLMCGACFAFFESAVLIAQSGGTEWWQTVLLRVSTSLLHITASGVVGWGLASAWSEKRRGRAIVAILAAAGVHGLWNSMAIILLISGFLTDSTYFVSNTILSGLMGLILVGVLAALISINRALRKQVESMPPTTGTS